MPRWGRHFGIGLFLLGVHGGASATVFNADDFTVEHNGNALFYDSFSDGVVTPPPTYADGAGASYNVNGVVSESGGKLRLDTNVPPSWPNGHGFTPFDSPTYVSSVRLLTPRFDREKRLGSDDTFSASVVFDLANPGPETEAYRLSLTDRTKPSNVETPDGRVPNPADDTNDTLRFGVERGDATRPILGGYQGGFEGQSVIFLRKLDYVANTSTDLGSPIPIDLSGSPDQVRFTFTKASSTSNEVTASYEYLKGGTVLSSHLFATDAAVHIFSDEAFTRAEVNAFKLVSAAAAAPRFAARLVTGSPTSISQSVDTPAAPFNLEFDYLFGTTTGALTISLDGIILGTLTAPAALGDTFITESLLVDSATLLGQGGILLEFTLDGPTGSVVSLDNISFPGLANGDFQTGNLSAWTVSASGAGGVGVDRLAVAAVPEPGAVTLLFLGLTLLLGGRGRAN